MPSRPRCSCSICLRRQMLRWVCTNLPTHMIQIRLLARSMPVGPPTLVAGHVEPLFRAMLLLRSAQRTPHTRIASNLELRGAVVQKVLIVDDSKLARMAVRRVLTGLRPSWVSSEAASVDEALASIRKGSPDFVLLDYNMPGKDGLALAIELRGLDPQIPVAVISANHQVEVVHRVRAAGAAFIPKPLTEQALDDFLSGAARASGGCP